MTSTWRLAPPRDGTQHTIDLLVDDTMLAAIRYEFDAEKAAAHLMVAAPDLLSIVKRFVALPSAAWHPVRHAAEEAELMQAAHAAIAKAGAI